MKLENKYVVLKREKIGRVFDAIRMARHVTKERDYFEPVAFIDAFEFESFLNAMMVIVGNDYFVMNLDESAAVDAMERYFHYNDQDKVEDDSYAINQEARFKFEEHMKKAKHDTDTVPKV